jgi:hypothetical protein
VICTRAEPLRPPIAGLDTLGLRTGFTSCTPSTTPAGSTPTSNIEAHDRSSSSTPVTSASSWPKPSSPAACTVTVLERLDNVLPRTIDHELADEVAAELDRRGVDVSCGTTVAEIQRDGDRLIVKADDGARSADAVLVVSGVTPSSDLAASAGVQVDGRGAIIVDRRMRTNVPDVWAAGDCFHTHHVLLAEPTYLPLGTTGPQAWPSRWRECRRW